MAAIGTNVGPTITVKGTPKKAMLVSLVGVDYEAFAPKRMLALTLMTRFSQAGKDPALMGETIEAIVIKMFGKTVAPAVMDRLNDEDDDLDFDHIMQLMNAMIEIAAEGDPTT